MTYDWQTHWLRDWLIDWLTNVWDMLTDGLTDWLTDHWRTGRLTQGLTNRLTEELINRLTDWPTNLSMPHIHPNSKSCIHQRVWKEIEWETAFKTLCEQCIIMTIIFLLVVLRAMISWPIQRISDFHLFNLFHLLNNPIKLIHFQAQKQLSKTSLEA